MIGLVDYDFYSASAITKLIPNIEIMKLATYYKAERNIFCRLIDLNETELSNYDNIYFFSESEQPIQVPDAFKKATNIIFGGTNFTKNYIPFEEQIIDYTIPRPAIYKEILKKKYQEGIKSHVITHILDDSYYRMFAGDKVLPIPPVKTKKRIFIFDKDIFHPGWEEVLNKVAERNPAKILTIHPARCKTLTQYFTLRGIEKMGRANEVILDLDIPLDEVHYMLKNYKNKFLADITESSNVSITLGGDFRYSKFYLEDFIYKMNILFSFWACKIPLKIKYEQPSLGYVDPLFHLSKLVEGWSKGPSKKNKSLAERTLVQQSGKIGPAREARNLLQEKYPAAKDLFNHNFTTLSAKGVWRI